jgi:hypothetical protein
MILRPITTGGADAAIAQARVRTGLVGDKDGINQQFRTAEDFKRLGNVIEWVYLNGQLLREGASNDYVASESGGAGTGFDTITFAFPPLAVDDLSIIYIPAN